MRVQVDFPVLGDPEGAPLRSCRVAVWVPPPVLGVTGGDVAGLVLVGEGLPAGRVLRGWLRRRVYGRRR